MLIHYSLPLFLSKTLHQVKQTCFFNFWAFKPTGIVAQVQYLCPGISEDASRSFL